MTPTLLVCAAVNVSDYGRTATGADVAGFVFSAEHIGGPLGGMETARYEAAADGCCPSHSSQFPSGDAQDRSANVPLRVRARK